MLVIRLARQGAHKVPFYHINLADRRRARNGRFIEKLGFYNPLAKGEEVCIRVNRERVDYWVERGALPSETVGNLIKKLNKAGGISELLGKDRQRRRIKGKKKEESAEQLAEQTEYAAEQGAGVKTEIEETPPQPAAEAESSAPPEETPPKSAAAKEAKTEVESSPPPEETPSQSGAAKEAKTEVESSAPPEETPPKSGAAKEAKTEVESSAPPEETPPKSAAAKEAKTEAESSPPTKETPKGSEEPKK